VYRSVIIVWAWFWLLEGWKVASCNHITM
jgi:hypothetical protein